MQSPLQDFMRDLKCFTFTVPQGARPPESGLTRDKLVANFDVTRRRVDLYCYGGGDDVRSWLNARGVESEGFAEKQMSLEDAFIGVTGKY